MHQDKDRDTFIFKEYNLLSEEENELRRLKREVHYYLDSLWLFSSNRGKSRTALYKWLSTQMNISLYSTHVKYFDINRCKQALKILKSRYKQYYGKNNISKTEKKKIDEINKIRKK